MTKGTNGIHHHLWHSPSKMKFWTIFHSLNNFLKFVTHRNMFAFFLFNFQWFSFKLCFINLPLLKSFPALSRLSALFSYRFIFESVQSTGIYHCFFIFFHFPNSSASLPWFFLVEFPVLFLFLHLPTFSTKFAFEHFYHQRSCHSTRCLLAALSRRSLLVRRPVF